MVGISSAYAADGATNQTRAGFVKSGLTKDGDYPSAPPPPPPPPPADIYKPAPGQVGSVHLENEKKLEDALMKHRNISRAQAQSEIAANKKARGYK